MNLPHNFMREYYKQQKSIVLNPGNYTSAEIQNARTIILAPNTTVMVSLPYGGINARLEPKRNS